MPSQEPAVRGRSSQPARFVEVTRMLDRIVSSAIRAAHLREYVREQDTEELREFLERWKRVREEFPVESRG